MALQFHPEYANLLAVGCYDGSVAVYDVRQKTNKPLYSMSAKAKKHLDTIWQVCWQVSNWIGVQDELVLAALATPSFLTYFCLHGRLCTPTAAVTVRVLLLPTPHPDTEMLKGPCHLCLIYAAGGVMLA
jgi:dynein intermediate chain 1